MSHKIKLIVASLAFATAAASLCEPALASSGGGGLPWESPLQQIQQSITGPVAGFIALAAVTIAGAMLIFGGELNDFASDLRHRPVRRNRRIDRLGSRSRRLESFRTDRSLMCAVRNLSAEAHSSLVARASSGLRRTKTGLWELRA